MIVGLGIDLVENTRIRDSIDRFGDRFLSRIYTQEEREYCAKCAHPVIHFAARFAAKEAALKALGTGLSGGIKWKDVAIIRSPSGKPELHLEGEALAVATALGASRFHVSLTHDQTFSSAVVILEA
jgi:holo-[acyl-carrier protein] synthase